MWFSDEKLMAYADGELNGAEAAEIESALRRDSGLAARVERFRSVRRALKHTYDSVVDEPIPEHLRALLGDVAAHEPPPPANIIDFGAMRRGAGKVSPPIWGAIAAALVIGVFAGRLVPPPSQSLLVTQNGQLQATAELTRALDTRLAADGENATSPLHIGVSFRANDGQYCRTFDSVRNAKAVSGLACRAPEGWVVRMAASESAATTDYRQAGSASQAVLNAVDALISGDPLDAAGERAARDKHWRE